MCNTNKRKPHKHADLIKAWAAGAEIQFYHSANGWTGTSDPEWNLLTEYRIKPEQSDLEKYGVEVGDVWSQPQVFVQRIDNGVAFPPTGSAIIFSDRDTLAFRRGVVNRL